MQCKRVKKAAQQTKETTSGGRYFWGSIEEMAQHAHQQFAPHRVASTGGDLRRQPYCRAQQARVAIARADELNADGQTVGALEKR